MAKKKKHYSRPHRSSSEVMRDMHGVAKFNRTGWALSWQDMTTMFDYVAWFKMRCREDWINKFHALVDSYWYQYECGMLTKEQFADMTWEYAGIKITTETVSKEDVNRLAQDPYLRMVGYKNLQRNNEILELHSIHTGCAISALHDMGWGSVMINRFQKYLEEIMGDVYNTTNSVSIRERLDVLKYQLENVGFEYEEIIDYADNKEAINE